MLGKVSFEIFPTGGLDTESMGVGSTTMDSGSGWSLDSIDCSSADESERTIIEDVSRELDGDTVCGAVLSLIGIGCSCG